MPKSRVSRRAKNKKKAEINSKIARGKRLADLEGMWNQLKEHEAAAKLKEMENQDEAVSRPGAEDPA